MGHNQYRREYGLIYTFSSFTFILLFVHHVKDRFPIAGDVENNGFEPLTLCVQGRCSSQPELIPRKSRFE